MQNRDSKPSVTFLIPARHASHSIEFTTRSVHTFLTDLKQRTLLSSFEIIVIPTLTDAHVTPDTTFEIVKRLSEELPHLCIVEHRGPIGKGAALRTGYAASNPKSDYVWFTDADLPYQLDFFERALHAHRLGFDLVTANRRLSTSLFDVPKDVLPLAIRRHRLGIAFNQAARLFLPITTTDTQAGAKAFSQALAKAFFSRSRCDGFFFDLELFLVAHALHCRHQELAVQLRLDTEKSTVRVLKQSLDAAKWLTLLAGGYLFGRYGRSTRGTARILLRGYLLEGGLSLGQKIFLFLRGVLTPYGEMAQLVSANAHVLDFGAGHGLLSLFLASQSSSRTVVALDHDLTRLKALTSAKKIHPTLNRQITAATELLPTSPPFDAITCIDVLHYFSGDEQSIKLREFSDLLKPTSGTLFFREIDPEGGWIARLNRAYEFLATKSGFTRSNRKTDITLRTPQAWESELRRAGFSHVTSFEMTSPLFSDRLFVGSHAPLSNEIRLKADLDRATPLRRSRKLIEKVCLLAALIVIPLYAAKVWLKTDYTDFLVYHRAATRLLSGDFAHLYSLADGASPFRYPPVTLPLWVGFGFFSYDTGRLLWYFSQILFVWVGFSTLFRFYRRWSPHTALIVTGLSFLMVLRFWLDNFTIGQVMSLLFVLISLAFVSFSSGRNTSSGLGFAAGVFGAGLFKIGPLILFGPAFFSRTRFSRNEILIRSSFAFLFLVAITSILFYFTGGSLTQGFADWIQIVLADSEYYDASHYGSQSLKSVLLRLGLAGLHLPLFLTLFFGTLAFWFVRVPRGRTGRSAFFCTALFLFLWLMPETFKYALTLLAFPLSLLLSRLYSLRTSFTEKRLIKLSMGLVILTLSLAGKDLLPEIIFFGLQRHNIPFFVTSFLGGLTYWIAFQHSEPRFIRKPKARWIDPHPLPSFTSPPPSSGSTIFVLLDLRSHRSFSVEGLQPWCPSLKKERVILCPILGDSLHRKAHIEDFFRQQRITFEIASPAQDDAGALRAGLQKCNSSQIFVLDLRETCVPGFFTQALALQASQPHLSWVRLSRNRFNVSTRYLEATYRSLQSESDCGLVMDSFSSQGLFSHAALEHFLRFSSFSGERDGSGFWTELTLAFLAADLKGQWIGGSVYRKGVNHFTRGLSQKFKHWLKNPGFPKLNERLRPLKQLSADDFGLTPGINDGILELCRAGLLKRVAIMADGPALTHKLSDLRAYSSVSLGIHFNLTYGNQQPFGHQGAGAFLIRSFFESLFNRKSFQRRVAEALESQLALLSSQKIEVRYFDGHHHCHLFFGVMSACAPILKRRGITRIRVPLDPHDWKSPTQCVLNLLSFRLRKRLQRQGFTFEPIFYPKPSLFRDPIQTFYQLNRHYQREIIVHPALRADLDQLPFFEPYNEPRVTEFRCLTELAETQRAPS